MAKKVIRKVKRSPSKSKKSKGVSASARRNGAASKSATAQPPVQVHPLFAQAVQNYEAALKAMQTRKFDKAIGFFEKIIAIPGIELADRARVYQQQCKLQMAK